MMRSTVKSLAVAAGCFYAISAGSTASAGTAFAGADQMGSTSSSEIRQLLEGLKPLSSSTSSTSEGSARTKPTPPMSFGTPSGYGANASQAFVGYSYSVDQNHSIRNDGSITMGAGFGDSINSVGLEVDVDLNGISNNGGENFGDAGTVGFKIHKVIPNSNGLGIAAGWATAKDWGVAKDAEETIYVAGTKGFELLPNCEGSNTLPVEFTLGFGSGAYRKLDDFKTGDNHPSMFGSAGIQLIPELSFATSWTGNSLNAGFGITPFYFPVSLSVGYTDVTDKTVTGRAYNFNIGYSFNY